MLYELYEYAIKNHLAARPGFKPKHVKAYVCLSVHGEFLCIDPGPEDTTICPDMGSMAQGATKCNVLVEKRLIPLSNEKPQKHSFYMEALKEAAAKISLAAVLEAVLADQSKVERINQSLDEQKIKPGDIIGFKVDGIPLETLVDDWWPEFLEKQNAGRKSDNKKRCFITGKMETPLSTVPKIAGLRAVGGHSSGDAIVCFDKDAFCSYGLKKAENVSIGEDSIVAVNAALTELIQNAKNLAGAKWVHWYKEPLSSEEVDSLGEMFGGPVTEEEDEEDTAVSAARADVQADRLIESHRTGEQASALNDNIYYIMPISGAGGRIMIRGWQQGSYEELQKAMNTWWEDLALCVPSGGGMLRRPPIGKINYRLLKVQNSGKSVSDRMRDELSGLEPRLIFAILNQNPLPDAVAARALQYIRSKLLDKDNADQGREPIPDPVSCQILKAWIIRKDRLYQQGGTTMQETCNPDYPEVAYQCGRMMAVYAAIQTKAMGKNLGAGVIQRYYTSASTTPALVFGRLSQLCQHHLAKIDSRGTVVYYENLLSEISQKIGTEIPATLNLRQQAEFSLGYYQQRAAMFQKNTDKTNKEEQ